MRHLVMLWAAVWLSASAPASLPEPGMFTYHGFRFNIERVAGTPDEQALLSGARAQVDIVEAVGLSPETLTFLRGYPISLSLGQGGGHFGSDGITVNLPARPDDRPILLHEELHAFQHGRLPGGVGNPALRRYFARARTPGLWPKSSYMLKNNAEFFAMTASVALYGHADRPPFTRAALAEKQPQYLKWIEENVR